MSEIAPCGVWTDRTGPKKLSKPELRPGRFLCVSWLKRVGDCAPAVQQSGRPMQGISFCASELPGIYVHLAKRLGQCLWKQGRRLWADLPWDAPPTTGRKTNPLHFSRGSIGTPLVKTIFGRLGITSSEDPRVYAGLPGRAHYTHSCRALPSPALSSR